jgi:hypothetical protein
LPSAVESVTTEAKNLVLSISDLYGGRTTLTLLREYDSARACVLEPVSGNWNVPPGNYEGYRVKTTAQLNAADAKLAATLLQDAATYDWPDKVHADGSVESRDTACQPFYHVRFEFKRGDEVLAVNFCFFCPRVLVALNGKVRQQAMLGPRSPEVLTLLARIFPRDKLLKMAVARQTEAGKPAS